MTALPCVGRLLITLSTNFLATMLSIIVSIFLSQSTRPFRDMNDGDLVLSHTLQRDFPLFVSFSSFFLPTLFQHFFLPTPPPFAVFSFAPFTLSTVSLFSQGNSVAHTSCVNLLNILTHILQLPSDFFTHCRHRTCSSSCCCSGVWTPIAKVCRAAFPASTSSSAPVRRAVHFSY